jgi:hypothetical protein
MSASGSAPRRRESKTKVDENEIVTRIAAELNKLTESKSNPLGDNLTRARESLNEVKALTEYEDQKATPRRNFEAPPAFCDQSEDRVA